MPVPARFFRSRHELRAWFGAHHADAPELWVGFHKAHTGRAGAVYLEAVEEALCFGWIDTTVRRIDADRYANRFTPRRPGSQWSAVNRRRFAELEKAGRVHESGRRAFDRRPRREAVSYSSERTFRLAPTFVARLRERPVAERFFRSRPRGYRRRATFWVMNAVRPETRARRFEVLLVASSAGTVPAALLLPGEVAPQPSDRSGSRIPPVRAGVRRSRPSRSGDP
ncbi:MAG: YdeI/OmpD-associated family protein [Thermoplasmata archaeon]